MTSDDESGFSLDTWRALLAGSNAWATGERRHEAWNRLLAVIQLFALATTLATLWWAPTRNTDNFHLTMTLATISLSLLMVPPLMRATRLPAWPRGVIVNSAARVTLVVVACLSIYGLLPGWHALWSAPLAIAMGIDASLTCSELGWTARPWLWYRRFLVSGFHLGIVGALTATLVAGGASRSALSIPLFACLHVWAITETTTLWISSTLQQDEDREREAAFADLIEGERRQRAHWLHDDVCAELHLVSLKLQTNFATTDEVVGLLNDFDHQLRLRQLEELFGAGRIRLAEVLQPYIRHAQNQGVQIDGVPGFEHSAITLDEREARWAARAVSNLTSNSLNVGATSVTYEAHVCDGMLNLIVSDDGPGFNLAEIPQGRGLWTLIHDLKPGGVAVGTSDAGGARVTVSIPYTERVGRGLHSARR